MEGIETRAAPHWHARYVVDTNVPIAASAAMARRRGATLLPHHREVSPPDPARQEQVLRWLEGFAASPAHLVLDVAGAINVEYHHKLDFHDYGIEVVMAKLYRDEVDRVQVDYDRDGAGILPQPLDEVCTSWLTARWWRRPCWRSACLAAVPSCSPATPTGTTGRANSLARVSSSCH